MNRSKILTAALALGVAAIIGISGTAIAYPGNHMGGQALTQEQQAAAQEVYADYARQTAPLKQQLMMKRAELDALYYGQNTDSGKAQALYKEIADIQSKLYTADAELRQKLAAKGVPMGGYGMHHGAGMGGGQGMYHGNGRHGGYGGGRGMNGCGNW